MPKTPGDPVEKIFDQWAALDSNQRAHPREGKRQAAGATVQAKAE
jgi:hypothetical protein